MGKVIPIKGRVRRSKDPLDNAIAAARRADLAASGISEKDARRLLIMEPSDEQTTDALVGGLGKGVKAACYEFKYPDLYGAATEFSRWKLMPLQGDPPMRYYQEPRTIPRLYLPSVVDWHKIANDPRRLLTITEGEKKAACATLMGMPTIGMGGVWNWRSKGWGLDRVPDVDRFVWTDREVEVCFDGDMSSNAEVAKAVRALTSKLADMGARVFVRYLPAIKGRAALDDFLVAEGLEAYRELERAEADSSAVLHRLNAELAFVTSMNCAYSVTERMFYPSTQKLQFRYGGLSVESESGPVPASNAWARWPHRRNVERITYEPGRPSTLPNAINAWKGLAVAPKKGDVSGLLSVVSQVEGWEWLLQWLAYPLQNLGHKLFTATLLWSPETGTGKSFLGYVMRDIYGPDNSSVITSADLHDDSFVWLRNKQFVLGEEVSTAGAKSDSGVLKHIITGETIRVNEKYVPTHEVPNKANAMFNSNYPDGLRIEGYDRRIFVGRMSQQRERTFWDRLDAWRHKGPGAAAWLWHLLERVDCSTFNPRAEPPFTMEKGEMSYAGMSSLEQWCADFMADPEAHFGEVHAAMKGRDVFAVKEIVALMPDELRVGVGAATNTQVGRALARLGSVRAGPISVANSRVLRLLAVRNLDYWKKHIMDTQLWARNHAGQHRVSPDKGAPIKTSRKSLKPKKK